MGRVVAVKVLPRHKTTPESIASFIREIRTQAQLDHENLVRAYDAGHDQNVHFLVTEYVPGNNLRQLIRREGRLSMQSAASIISQAARGLAYAHSRGLIHRDVKPGNLLVTPDGHTKVSDLGLSGYFNDPEQTDIHGGKVVGTADYLAPEQISAPERPTPVSDIYALGCTLYYAVTGKVPFPGGTPREKARKHCNEFPLDPRRLNSELSDEFVEVIADMMAKKPDERIPTAGDVIERLAPWVEGVAAAQRASLGAEPVQLSYSPPRPAEQPLSDTTPIFVAPQVEDPSQIESASQMSLGTQPVNLTSQETLPMFPLEGAAWDGQFGSLSPAVKILIGVGMITAVGTILAVVVSLIYHAWVTP
jgi:serine/threonine protein kinase